MDGQTNNTDWHWYEKLTFRFFFVFVLCFVCSFSFPHFLLPDVGKVTSPFFEALASGFAEHILHLRPPYSTRLYSDTTGLYVDALMLLCFAAMAAIVWPLLEKPRRANYSELMYWFAVFISYYLAMQLFRYGADKLFKTQFYLPEPNTLYTTLGNTSPDLLYWSTMGISRPYCIFTGSIELLCAGLLLFARTRRAGALLSCIVLANVVVINLSFDISVKLYSIFLLLLSVILCMPWCAQVLRSVSRKSALAVAQWRPAYSPGRNRSLYVAVKSLIILLILADTFSGYFYSGNLNDDAAPRPYLHGAYHVSVFIRNNDTLPPLETDTTRWRRIFIHRQSYLIAQSMNDNMHDYLLSYDTANKLLMISDHNGGPVGLFNYTAPDDSSLLLAGNIRTDSVQIHLHRQDQSRLPLFSTGFHWTIDQ